MSSPVTSVDRAPTQLQRITLGSGLCSPNGFLAAPSGTATLNQSLSVSPPVSEKPSLSSPRPVSVRNGVNVTRLSRTTGVTSTLLSPETTSALSSTGLTSGRRSSSSKGIPSVV